MSAHPPFTSSHKRANEKRLTFEMHRSEIFDLNEIIHELFAQRRKKKHTHRKYENEIRFVSVALSLSRSLCFFCVCEFERKETKNVACFERPKSNNIRCAHMLRAAAVLSSFFLWKKNTTTFVDVAVIIFCFGLLLFFSSPSPSLSFSFFRCHVSISVVVVVMNPNLLATFAGEYLCSFVYWCQVTRTIFGIRFIFGDIDE